MNKHLETITNNIFFLSFHLDLYVHHDCILKLSNFTLGSVYHSEGLFQLGVVKDIKVA
jgi:hypothetical protein